MIQLNPENPLQCIDLGTIGYQPALKLQQNLHTLRIQEKIPDTALFLEHNHVYTLGKRGDSADVLLDTFQLHKRGVEVFRSDRGGQVTYHGPGQLVVYLIINLYNAQRELRLFVETLESTMIGWLANEFGIVSHIEAEHPGVWVGEHKIAALGITVKNRVTMHGLALNVDPDLSFFAGIVPCGIRDRGVTSISKLIPESPAMTSVKDSLAKALASQFGKPGIIWADPGELPENQS